MSSVTYGRVDQRKPPVPPSIDLTQPGIGREYECETIGARGVFFESVTFVGRLYLSETMARANLKGKNIRLAEGVELPAPPEADALERRLQELEERWRRLSSGPATVPREQKEETPEKSLLPPRLSSGGIPVY